MPILLRNKGRSLAQQTMLRCATKWCLVAQQSGAWLRKAVGGCLKLQGKRCAPLGQEVRAFQVRDAHCLGMK